MGLLDRVRHAWRQELCLAAAADRPIIITDDRLIRRQELCLAAAADRALRVVAPEPDRRGAVRHHYTCCEPSMIHCDFFIRSLASATSHMIHGWLLTTKLPSQSGPVHLPLHLRRRVLRRRSARRRRCRRVVSLGSARTAAGSRRGASRPPSHRRVVARQAALLWRPASEAAGAAPALRARVRVGAAGARSTRPRTSSEVIIGPQRVRSGGAPSTRPRSSSARRTAAALAAALPTGAAAAAAAAAALR